MGMGEVVRAWRERWRYEREVAMGGEGGGGRGSWRGWREKVVVS